MSDIYSNRSSIIKIIFVVVSVIFVVRLFFLQIVNNDYKMMSERNAFRYITQYPARGLVYDRNGKLLVYNEAVYDLMVIPRQVKNIDTVAFCELVGITRDEFIQKMKKPLVFGKA